MATAQQRSASEKRRPWWKRAWFRALVVLATAAATLAVGSARGYGWPVLALIFAAGVAVAPVW